MVQKNIFPLIAIGVLLTFSLTATALNQNASAHAPTSLSATMISETTIQVNWTHSGAAGCATSDSGSTCLTDVDIVRTPGCNTTNTYCANIGNSTAHVVANNATGLTSWIDHGLPQGSDISYTICHAEKDTATCAAGATDGTNEGKAAPLDTQTKSSAVSNINVSLDSDRATLTWGGLTANHTQLAGYKIQYSTDLGTNWTTSNSNSSSLTKSHDVSGLNTSTSYVFRVAGVTESNSGGGSVGTYAGSGENGTITSVITKGDEPAKKVEGPLASVVTSGAITDDNLRLTLTEDLGWDRILNIALYTNVSEDGTIADSDTFIVWNFFEPLYVSDPNGYFDDVNVITEQSGVRTMDVTYEITWAKPLAKANAIVEMLDFQSNLGTVMITDAWSSFPTATRISQEIPDETPGEAIGTVATLWNGGVMNHVFLNNNIDYALLSDAQYFVDDEVIDIAAEEQVIVQVEEEVVTKELFESITLDQHSKNIGKKYLDVLVISGTVSDEFHTTGSHIIFSIIGPDGTISEIKAVTTSDRTFKLPIIIEEFEAGTYQFQPMHDSYLGEPFLFNYQ